MADTRDLVIISMHEKGFPQGDLHIGHGDTPADEFNCLGRAADGWFSLNRGATLEMARAHARKLYPEANIVDAKTDEDDDDEDTAAIADSPA